MPSLRRHDLSSDIFYVRQIDHGVQGRLILPSHDNSNVVIGHLALLLRHGRGVYAAELLVGFKHLVYDTFGMQRFENLGDILPGIVDDNLSTSGVLLEEFGETMRTTCSALRATSEV